LGVDASRSRVHTSIYAGLRTNLPREVMGYEAFPFTGVFGGDPRRFCGHAEVRAYLAGAYNVHFTSLYNSAVLFSATSTVPLNKPRSYLS
jgi:cation diffusion facilitator CzcD-associated flavoprotein CzcO